VTLLDTVGERDGADDPDTLRLGRVPFAHESERRFAALLDANGIEWHYEPRTFVLERYDDGAVKSAFTPDFYLPAFDTYVEITTLRQKLVTKKNRKIRLFRAAHPDIDLIVLYQRDIAALFAPHGTGVATAAG
jgi:hypothetical protein